MKKFPAILAVAILCLSGACRERSRTKTPMDTSAEQEQAIRVLREAYAAFNRGDIAAAVEPLDPQIEWTEPTESPAEAPTTGMLG
jgi:hypothetical protein